MRILSKMIQAPLLLLIKIYSRFISPLTPPSCRFVPTCSSYASEAIQTWGPWKGSYLAIKRLLICHPFTQEKDWTLDPVPKPVACKHGACQ